MTGWRISVKKKGVNFYTLIFYVFDAVVVKHMDKMDIQMDKMDMFIGVFTELKFTEKAFSISTKGSFRKT